MQEPNKEEIAQGVFRYEVPYIVSMEDWHREHPDCNIVTCVSPEKHQYAILAYSIDGGESRYVLNRYFYDVMTKEPDYDTNFRLMPLEMSAFIGFLGRC